MTAPRHANYETYRRRQALGDELPWVRPSELARRQLPRPVVLVNGAFDLLHSNHMRVLFAARAKARGGTVICAMDSDERVRQAKGPGRPILSWVERATMMQYMPVDFLVEIDSEADFKALVRAVKPDFRVQGAEYRGRTSRFPSLRKIFVANRGVHTSELIKRCKTVERI